MEEVLEEVEPTMAMAEAGGTDIRIGSTDLYSRVIVAGGRRTDITMVLDIMAVLEEEALAVLETGDGEQHGGGGSGGSQIGGGAGGARGRGNQSGSQDGYYDTGGGAGGRRRLVWRRRRPEEVLFIGAILTDMLDHLEDLDKEVQAALQDQETNMDGFPDAEQAEAGGSGYVLTSSSNKPGGYKLGSQYYMTNTQNIRGDQSFPAPTGGSETGHSGHGYARITLVE